MASTTCRSLCVVISASALVIILPGIVGADEGDDMLRSYLAKSDLVLAGRIQSEPFAFSTEIGVANYHFDFKISNVLKGDVAAGQTLPVKDRSL